MIEYWHGFEIDGSDTSYNLVVSEHEKCFELLNYFLNLKIIHKGLPVKVHRASGKGASLVLNRSFEREQLEELWDILRSTEIKFIELEYTYVAPNSLYPEVKRELIDLLLNMSKTKVDFTNPMFDATFAISDYVSVNFDSKLGKYSYDMAFSETYFQGIMNNHPSIQIDFNCVLGGPTVLSIYGMYKIKEAFPEFEIDLMQNAEMISWTDVKWYNFIKEGIIIESTDYVLTLEKILMHPIIVKSTKDSSIIELRRLPYNIGNFDPSKLFQYEGGFEDEYWKDSIINKYKALKGIFGKNKFTINEYVASIQKLAKAEIFTDSEFEYYSAFDISLYLEAKNYYCNLMFVRGKRSPYMVLIVPHKYRERIRKVFAI